MAPANLDVESVLRQLTLEEKCSLLAGKGRWHTMDIPRLGVPSVRFADAPSGCRGIAAFNGCPGWLWPCGTGLAATWDDELIVKVGQKLGVDSRAKGVHVLYGPMVNIPRSPLPGRGFECFSEDPRLSGKIGSAYIRGLQSEGVQACLKHAFCNDQEMKRYSTSSIVEERALREIYLKAFEIAVKEGNPGSFMVSYNGVNGVPCVQNEKLIKDILRTEWGYEGCTISDYFAVSSVAEPIIAGLDVEMPGPAAMRGAALQRALMGGRVTERHIDVLVRRILQMADRALQSGIPADKEMELSDDPEIPPLLLQTAAQSIVLLKNENILPLNVKNGSIKTLAVIGPNAETLVSGGGGSAKVEVPYAVSALEGIKKLVEPHGIAITTAPGCRTGDQLQEIVRHLRPSSSLDGEAGMLLEFFNQDPWVTDSLPKPDYSTVTHSTRCILIDNIPPNIIARPWIRATATFVPNRTGEWALGLIVAGQGNLYIDEKLVIENSTNQTLGDAFACAGSIEERATVHLEQGKSYAYEVKFHYGHQVDNSPIEMGYGAIELTGEFVYDEEEGLREAAEVAAKADAVVLVVGFPPEYEAEGYDRAHMSLTGACNELVTRVAKANPNVVVVNQSGMPIDMPWIDEVPSVLQAWYGGVEFGSGIASVLFGDFNPAGKLPMTFPKRLEDTPTFLQWGDEAGRTVYSEGIYVGYRYYDTKDIDVLFPFGHGLSYSRFDYANLSLKPTGDSVTVSFDVTNSGNYAGIEIAQVYVGAVNGKVRKAKQDLRGWFKVDLLPGVTAKATVMLGKDAFSHYDTQEDGWAVEAGSYAIRVGSSSRDIRLEEVTQFSGVASV